MGAGFTDGRFGAGATFFTGPGGAFAGTTGAGAWRFAHRRESERS